MWLYFCVWCAIIASVPVHHNTMEAFAFQVKRLPDIFWNTSNPIFRVDNHDHIIDVNQEDTGNPFDYDRINIVCPVYDKTAIPNAKDTEQFVIYHVTKEEYDTCIIRSHSPRIIAQCNSPYRQMVYPISFRSFTPMPNALEYKPGLDYHFISTSSKDDLHLRIGGMCLSNNMKIVFKVGLRHKPKSALSDTSSGKNKDIATSVNRLSKDTSYKGDDMKSPEKDVLLRSENDENITQKSNGKGKKHRGRRKNGERKRKKRKRGKEKNNKNKDHDSNHWDNNDVWDSKGSRASCPPGGCASNVVENHNNFEYTTNKKFRNNYPNPKGYATSDKRNRYGEMPSRDENLMNDKPRGGILQDERSDVEKVHDLMRQEPSISASSSASMNSSLLLSTKYWLPMATLIAYTFLPRIVS